MKDEITIITSPDGIKSITEQAAVYIPAASLGPLSLAESSSRPLLITSNLPLPCKPVEIFVREVSI